MKDKPIVETTNKNTVKISKTDLEIYKLLVDEKMCQEQILYKFNHNFQKVKNSIKILEKLELIKNINPNNRTRLYRATDITPIV